MRILTSQNPKDTPNILEELKAVMRILNQKQKQARVKLNQDIPQPHCQLSMTFYTPTRTKLKAMNPNNYQVKKFIILNADLPLNLKQGKLFRNHN